MGGWGGRLRGGGGVFSIVYNNWTRNVRIRSLEKGGRIMNSLIIITYNNSEVRRLLDYVDYIK